MIKKACYNIEINKESRYNTEINKESSYPKPIPIYRVLRAANNCTRHYNAWNISHMLFILKSIIILARRGLQLFC